MMPNPSLDELLCSFMDGELSPRQRTEVQRMAARDPDVTRRLRQLQSCRSLFSSLPPAEAPGDMLEQIKLSMERRTLLQEQPVFARRSVGAWHLVFRKFVAAAAMIALLAVLGAVVYQIVAPVASPGLPSLVAEGRGPRWPGVNPVAPRTVVADAGFSGRLELKTVALIQADASIRRAIEDSGLAGAAEVDMIGGGRVYRLVSTREGVNRLITSLSGIWPNFDSATLHVNRLGESINAVLVEAVTPRQVASIVTSNSTQASIAAAQGYALVNGMTRRIPGSEVLAAINDDTGSTLAFMTVPKPMEAKSEGVSKTAFAPPQGDVEASLTIVLLGTR